MRQAGGCGKQGGGTPGVCKKSLQAIENKGRECSAGCKERGKSPSTALGVNGKLLNSKGLAAGGPSAPVRVNERRVAREEKAEDPTPPVSKLNAADKGLKREMYGNAVNKGVSGETEGWR